jgi:hypothetical protein
LSPNLAEARYHLGWVFEQTKDYNSAKIHYDLAQSLLGGRPATDPLRQEVERGTARIKQGASKAPSAQE